MSENKYSVVELKAKAVKIISTKSDEQNSWYMSLEEIYKIVFDEFFDYLELADLEKQRRKELYEQLKAEFEGK